MMKKSRIYMKLLEKKKTLQFDLNNLVANNAYSY